MVVSSLSGKTSRSAHVTQLLSPDLQPVACLRNPGGLCWEVVSQTRPESEFEDLLIDGARKKKYLEFIFQFKIRLVFPVNTFLSSIRISFCASLRDTRGIKLEYPVITGLLCPRVYTHDQGKNKDCLSTAAENTDACLLVVAS